jgi:hypothetical protein
MRLPTRTAAALGALIAVALVAGCSTATKDDAPATASPTASAPAAAVAPVSADGIDIGHVHNVSLDGDAVLLGTHEGLYRQDPGRPPAPVGDPFDVMGLTIDGDRWLSSGHPGHGMDAPADLGLRASTDNGSTWKQVSLAGEVDFHRLTASGATVLGVNSGDGLLWRSTDDGATWDTHGEGPFDLALNPADPKQGIATTSTGPLSSSDGGLTWTPIAGAPPIAFVAWTDTGIVGADPDGKIMRSTDGGTTWTQAGAVDGQPSGLAASGEHVVVLQGETLWESADAGATFTARINGLPGN